MATTYIEGQASFASIVEQRYGRLTRTNTTITQESVSTATACGSTQTTLASATGTCSSFPQNEAQSLEEFTNGKYHFRPSTIEFQPSFYNSWVDEDESGSYDPSGKLSRLTPPAPPPLKRKKDPNEDGEHNEAAKRPKSRTWLGGRQSGEKFLVVLKLSSETGLEILKLFPALEPPIEERFGIDDGNNEETSIFTASGGSFSSISPPPASYSLRNRGENLSKGEIFDQGGRSHNRHDHLQRPTLGNPLARGCEPCLAIGNPCSLLEYSAKWPCSVCVSDGMDCELIMPPLKKRRCEACKRGKLACSYRAEEEQEHHSLPCKQCQDSNTRCVAGPQSNRVRLPPVQDLSKLKESLKPFTLDPGRQYKACTPCRKERVKCSIRNLVGKGPCGQCRRLGQDCTFEDFEHPSRANFPSLNLRGKEQDGSFKPASRKDSKLDLVTRPTISTEEAMKSSLHRETIDLTLPPERHGFSSSSSSQSQAEVKTITTCFAHPMTFNHLPPLNGSEPCHFCNDIAFGIEGYGERKVEVIDYKDGKGFTEVQGGHTARNKDPTRMCMDCSLERVHIVNCHSHDICPIDGLNPEDFDHDLAFDILEQGSRTEDCPISWCSLCPAPAFYGCCARQLRNKWDEKIVDGRQEGAFGCGLLLCEPCAQIVRDYGGRLHPAVKALKRRFEGWNGKLRADVQFLLCGEDTRQWHG